MSDTDFNFGWNEVENNRDPWGSASDGPEDAPEIWETEATIEFVLKQVRLITTTVRKVNRMLPAAQSDTKQEKTKGKGSFSGRQSTGIPRLQNEHLTKQPKEAIIRSVRAIEKTFNGNTKQAVSFKIAMDGHLFLWDLTLNNPNLAIIQEKLGRDENDYAGRNILIFLEMDEHTEQWWPRVSFPAEKEKTSRNR